MCLILCGLLKDKFSICLFLLQEHKHSCKTAMANLESYSKDLHRNFLGSDDQSMFVSVKKTKVVLSKYSEQLNDIAQAPKKVTLEFQPNKSIAKFFTTLKGYMNAY